MNHSRWLSLTPDEIAPPVRPDDAPWSMEFASPYDVPSHVRSSFDKHTGHLVIEFRYIAQEHLRRVDVGRYGHAMVGSKSGRLWLLELDVHAVLLDKVRMQDTVERGINAIPRSEASNVDIARRAINEKRRVILDHAFAG